MCLNSDDTTPGFERLQLTSRRRLSRAWLALRRSLAVSSSSIKSPRKESGE